MTDPNAARDAEGMRGFWNEKAAENPWWYVASSVDYDNPDLEFFFRTGEEHVAEILTMARMEPSGDERVLEIGCGAGRMTRALARRFGEVWALDVSETMIEVGKKHLADHANITWLVGSGVDLAGVPDASFDLVTSIIVFRHLPSSDLVRRYIEESARVLRDGGHFVFETTTESRGARWKAQRIAFFARDLVKRRGPRGIWSRYFSGNSTPPERLREYLRDAGFRIDAEKAVGSPETWIAATRLPR